MRKLPVLLLLALLALVSGCGGGDEDSSVDGILKATFGSNASVKSGKLGLTVDANVTGIPNLQGPVAVKLNGPFQSADGDSLPKFDFTLAITTGGQTFNAGAVSTSDKGWVKFQNQAYSVEDKLFAQFKTGYAQSRKENATKEKKAPTFGSLGVDPRKWLTNPKKAGTEEIGGAETDHITAGIDVPKLLDDVDRLLGRAGTVQGQKARRLTPAQRKQVEDAVTSAKVDIFSGTDDQQLRRLAVDIKLKTGTLRFALQLDGLNDDVQITPPANAKPLQELLSSLQGGGPAAPGAAAPGASPGAATPGAATPATPGTATPGAGSGANAKYTQCITAAGSDLQKVQDCAKLLSGG